MNTLLIISFAKRYFVNFAFFVLNIVSEEVPTYAKNCLGQYYSYEKSQSTSTKREIIFGNVKTLKLGTPYSLYTWKCKISFFHFFPSRILNNFYPLHSIKDTQLQ